MSGAGALPLEGVRVLDVGNLIAGPFASTMLGDFGAEVIKVEQPGRGDALRGTPTSSGAARSPSWLVFIVDRPRIVSATSSTRATMSTAPRWRRAPRGKRAWGVLIAGSS